MSFSLDLIPASAFDRVINTDDQFTTRRKGPDQHSQRHLRGPERRPSRTIERAMTVLKALVLAVACRTQTGRDSSTASGQNGPDQQGFGGLPNRFVEKRRELYISGNNSAGNVSIRKTPFGEEIFRSLCGLPLLFQRPGMDKVRLRVRASAKNAYTLFKRERMTTSCNSRASNLSN
jgi:hypothetical protein